MEAAIQQQDNVIFNAIMAIVVAAFLLLCAAMAWRDAGHRPAITETATMQWASDTSWTGGGWR